MKDQKRGIEKPEIIHIKEVLFNYKIGKAIFKYHEQTGAIMRPDSSGRGIVVFPHKSSISKFKTEGTYVCAGVITHLPKRPAAYFKPNDLVYGKKSEGTYVEIGGGLTKLGK